MTEILLVLVLVLLVPVFALSVVLSARLWRQEKLQDRKCQEQEEAPDKAEEDRSMDEGFSNLMTYSVKLGRGRTSGGEP